MTLLTCTLLYVIRKTLWRTCASRMSTFKGSWTRWGRKSRMLRISSKIEPDHSTEIRKVLRREAMRTLVLPQLMSLIMAMNLNLSLSQGWIHLCLWCTREKITHLPDVLAVSRVSKILQVCWDKTLGDPTLKWSELQLSLPTIVDPRAVVALYKHRMRTPLLKALSPRIRTMLPVLNRRSRL